MRHRRPTRALRLTALLAAATLGVAACSGSGDAGTAASVGDTDIELSQFEQRYERVASSDTFAQQLEADESGDAELSLQADVLTELVRTQLLERAVTELELDEVTPEDVASEREALVEEFGGEEQLEQRIAEVNLTTEDVERQLTDQVRQERITAEVADEVPDAQVREAYDQQFGDEQRSARHILVADEAAADDALERVQGGEDFAEVATDVSTDPGSAEQGGDLGVVARGSTVEPFEEAVFSADEGELVGPVETEFGFHVIEVTEIADPPPFDEVAEQLRTDLRAQQGQQAFGEYLTTLSSEAGVEVNPRFGEWDAQALAVVPELELRETAPQGSAPAGGGSAPAAPPSAPAPGGEG